MCFEWFCLIQPAIDSPPAMCPTSVWRCGDIMLSLHPRLGRLHAHRCGHDFGIITEVEHRKIDVRLRSHAFCAANYYYPDPYSTRKSHSSQYIQYPPHSRASPPIAHTTVGISCRILRRMQ